jgi:integrase
MATIRKRGDRWQAQVRQKGHAPVSKSFLTKSDAEAWGRQIEAQLERSSIRVDMRLLTATTFNELLDRYSREVTPLKRGAATESLRISKFQLNPFARLSLDRLTPEVFARFRDTRLREVGADTVRREMTILGHVLEVARREWGYPLTENPLAAVRRPKPGNSRDRRLGVHEFEQLMAAVEKSRSRVLRSAVLLAIETGLRRGELVAMCWRDIDWRRRVLRVPTTKTGIPRTVPLSPKALCLLFGLGPMGATVLGVSGDGLRHGWERLCRRAGVADLHFHDLRHEAISRFFELGLSLPEVAVISGHREPRMLLRYTHLCPSGLAHKLNRLSASGADYTSVVTGLT